MVRSYPKNYITFILLHTGQEYQVQTYRDEYRDLRALIADRLLLEDFGQCGGMGRCATCMIKINGSNHTAMERNEPATLAKYGAKQANIRLACQVPVTDDLANTTILVF